MLLLLPVTPGTALVLLNTISMRIQSILAQRGFIRTAKPWSRRLGRYGLLGGTVWNAAPGHNQQTGKRVCEVCISRFSSPTSPHPTPQTQVTLALGRVHHTASFSKECGTDSMPLSPAERIINPDCRFCPGPEATPYTLQVFTQVCTHLRCSYDSMCVCV